MFVHACEADVILANGPILIAKDALFLMFKHERSLHFLLVGTMDLVIADFACYLRAGWCVEFVPNSRVKPRHFLYFPPLTAEDGNHEEEEWV